MTQKKHKRALAKLLLHTEMLILFAFLAIFIWQYLGARRIDPLFANSYYGELAEYIVAAFVIAIASALLVERMEREGG